MQSLLYQILVIVIALDVFALGVLVVFLINARINVGRKITANQYHMDVLETAQKVETSQLAAETLSMPVEQFVNYCQDKGIELPEARVERIQRQKERKQAEQQRIMDEELAWRNEQEKLAEERNRTQEEAVRKRRERLRKFGFPES